MMSQKPETRKLVPITKDDLATLSPASEAAPSATTRSEGRVEFSPSPEFVLSRLLPKYLEFTIYSAMLETDAAFFAAQLVAMSNATDNAVETDRRTDHSDEQRSPGGDHQGNPRNRRRRGSTGRIRTKDARHSSLADATGKVVQVLGNVVDVEFTAETLPKINDALTVRLNDDGLDRKRPVPSGIDLGGTAMRRANSRSKCRTNSATTKCAASRWVRPTVSCAARRSPTPAARFWSRSAKARSDASSTCSGKAIDSSEPGESSRRSGRSTAPLRSSSIRTRRRGSSRRASRSST